MELLSCLLYCNNFWGQVQEPFRRVISWLGSDFNSFSSFPTNYLNLSKFLVAMDDFESLHVSIFYIVWNKPIRDNNMVQDSTRSHVYKKDD